MICGNLERLKHSNGFTIIELIVVIVVIAVLASIVTLTFSTVQKETNDSERASAVQRIMASIEKYYENNGEYPYGNDMNPTYNLLALPSYGPVLDKLPDLTEDTLTAGGYHFMPRACAPEFSSCTANAAEITAMKTAYTYYAPRSGDTGSYLRLAEWGCGIDIASDANPGAVIVWQDEATKKWNFTRTKHGAVSISPYSSGPVSPTECKFTTL